MALLLVLWFVFTTIQVVVWWVLSSSLRKSDKTLPRVDAHPFVSILVAAKNEEQNLRKHLPLILGQDYPQFEVIVIDDHSKDNTRSLVSEFSKVQPKLKFVEHKGIPGKKQALLNGISHARGEWYGFIDADCYPRSSSWISGMLAHSAQYDVCLGYGPYEEKASFLNRFIRFETWYVGLQYLSFAACKMPYMGVGRNLFYSREVFAESDQMASHLDLLSGDDDLFISSLAPTTRIKAVMDPSTFTYSIPSNTWSAFFKQKSRHISTSVRYRRKIRVGLLVIHVSHIGSYITAVWIMLVCSFLVGIILLFVRFILVYVFTVCNVSVLEERKLEKHSWYLDSILVVFYFILATKLFSRSRKWAK